MQHAGQPPGHDGQERRGLDKTRPLPLRGASAATGVLLALTGLVILPFPPEPTRSVLDHIGGALWLATVAASALLACLCWVGWHLTNRASGARVGTAVAVFGTGAVAVDQLAATRFAAVPAETVTWLGPASRLTAIGLLVLAATGAQCGSRTRPRSTLLAAVGATAGLALALQLAPGPSKWVIGAADAMHGAEAGLASPLLIIVSLGTALLLAVQGARRQDAILLVGAVLAAGIGLAQLLASPEVGLPGASDADLLRAAGMILASIGAAVFVVGSITGQHTALLRSQEASRSAAARLEAESAARAELRHEANNALTAIAMATSTLQTFHDQLDPSFRTQLAEGVAGEVERLTALLNGEGATEAGPLRLRDSLEPLVATARAAGTDVRVEGVEGFVVHANGKALTQAFSNLFANARRHAPGSPVTVRANPDAMGGIVVRVEDRGPGIPKLERQRIFARGVQGTTGTQGGSGLGLHVTARLVREQGGAIWVDEREGGGASFAVWLPLHSAGEAAGFDERDELLEAGDAHAAGDARAVGAKDTDGALADVAPVGQADLDGGDHFRRRGPGRDGDRPRLGAAQRWLVRVAGLGRQPLGRQRAREGVSEHRGTEAYQHSGGRRKRHEPIQPSPGEQRTVQIDEHTDDNLTA